MVAILSDIYDVIVLLKKYGKIIVLGVMYNSWWTETNEKKNSYCYEWECVRWEW